jgi:drug/metabolite transporter (DMT)-like permease
MKQVSHLGAIAFAIGGYALWVLTDAGIKVGTGASVPIPEVAGIISGTGVAALLAKAFAHNEFHRLRPHNAGNQVLSAVLSIMAFLTCVIALKHLPFIIFYVGVFMAPMVVALLAAATLREHLSGGKSVAIIAGFLGVLIAMDPFAGNVADNMHGDWIGYTAIIINVFSFAGLMVLQRRIMQSETEESVAFIQVVAQTVVYGFWTIFAHVPLSFFILLVLLGSGIVSILGNLFNIIAAKHTTAANIAQFHYTQIISGALLGYLLWHEVPTLAVIAGSAIIIASGIYIATHARKHNVVTEAVAGSVDM